MVLEGFTKYNAVKAQRVVLCTTLFYLLSDNLKEVPTISSNNIINNSILYIYSKVKGLHHQTFFYASKNQPLFKRDGPFTLGRQF